MCSLGNIILCMQTTRLTIRDIVRLPMCQTIFLIDGTKAVASCPLHAGRQLQRCLSIPFPSMEAVESSNYIPLDVLDSRCSALEENGQCLRYYFVLLPYSTQLLNTTRHID